MSTYREGRERTLLVHLGSRTAYRRGDIMEMLRHVADNGKVEAVGQLEKNRSWEIVFKEVATKEEFMQSDVTVRERSAMRIFDFRHPTRKLRIVRVPTCIPNEFIAAKLNEKGVMVLNISYEINRIDGVMSHVRVATIDSKYGSYVPDVLPWVFDGLLRCALCSCRDVHRGVTDAASAHIRW